MSRTLRVITCSTRFGSVIGRLDVRPRDGFSPTTPHHAAGSRIEPPMSLACATGTSPAATAAAAPPLDPAVERSGVPRVAARAEGDRLGGRLAAELGQRRLADGDDAGGAEAGAEDGVGGCAPVQRSQQPVAHVQR